MKKYIKVEVEGPLNGDEVTLYQELESGVYSEDELLQIGQEMVNERYSWGIAIVDEDDVPEGEK